MVYCPQQGLLIIKMSRFGQTKVKTKRMGRIRLLDHLKMSSTVSSVSMSAANIVICYLLIGKPEQMQT